MCCRCARYPQGGIQYLHFAICLSVRQALKETVTKEAIPTIANDLFHCAATCPARSPRRAAESPTRAYHRAADGPARFKQNQTVYAMRNICVVYNRITTHCGWIALLRSGGSSALASPQSLSSPSLWRSPGSQKHEVLFLAKFLNRWIWQHPAHFNCLGAFVGRLQLRFLWFIF